MIPLLSKPKIEDVVDKEITLLGKRKWRRTGAIWTENKFDYLFVYRELEKCILMIRLEQGDIRFRWGNTFFLPGDHGASFVHGGRNPWCYHDEPSENYAVLDAYLTKVLGSKKAA